MLLECQSITKYYRNRCVLDHISFTIDQGQIITIIGPNGSGKTTLARILLGLTKPDEGKLIKKPGLTIGYMPQKLVIDPVMPLTVRRFITLALGHHKPSAESWQEAINDTGISHILDNQMHSISGGEQQRVMLAQLLLLKPELLVLDEPVQGVDVQGQAEFYQLIELLRTRYQISILMISHDLYMVMRSTNHVICMNHHICCEGSAEDVSRHDAYLQLFGLDAARNLAIYAHHHNHAHNLHGDVVCAHDHSDTPDIKIP